MASPPVVLRPDVFSTFEGTKERLIQEIATRLRGVFPPGFNAKLSFSVDDGGVRMDTIALEVRARQRPKEQTRM